MCCRIIELKNKEVICIRDATRLGYVNDVEIDTCSGKLVSLVIYGKPKFFGLLGKEEDIVIDWDCIEVIGDDTILVSYNTPQKSSHRNKFLEII